MLTDYIRAAMRIAHYEFLEEDGVFYGEVPPCRGVIASGKTLEECREELKSVLEGWIILSLKRNIKIPEINGITFESQPVINA